MNFIDKTTIKQKMIIIIMATTVVTVIIVALTITYLELASARKAMIERLGTLSSIVADRSTAAILFHDQEIATQMLSALEKDKSVHVACIYTESKELFAYYNTSGERECNTDLVSDTLLSEENYLHLSHTILLNGRNIGTLYITASLGEIRERLLWFGLTLIIVVLAASIGAYYLAKILQAYITKPIMNLTKATEYVAEHADYSRSLSYEKDDEIGILYRSFNKMIEQIRFRETERNQAELKLKISEKQLRDVINGLGPQMFVALLNTDGTIVDVNKPALDRAGLKRDDVLGKQIVDIYVFEYSGEVQQQMRASIERAARGVPSRYDLQICVKDNLFATIDFSIQPMRDESDQVVYLVTSANDITERVEAEEKRKQLVNIIEDSLNEIYLFSTDSLKFILVNKGGQQNLGYSMDELQYMTPLDIKPEFTIEKFESLILKPLLQGDKDINVFETVHKRKDGTLYPVEVHLQLHSDFEPNVFIAIILDISERKKIEAKIKEREQQLQLFIEHSPAAIAMFDNQMQYLAVSDRWLSDYRLGDEDIIGRRHYDIFPEVPEHWIDIHQRCLNGAIEKCDEESFIRGDGTTDWLRWEILPWRTSSGDIGGIIMFSELLTERKQAALDLKNSEERYRSLATQSPIGIYHADIDGLITYVNPKIEDTTGIPADNIMGNGWKSIVYEPDRKYIFENWKIAIGSGKTFFEEYRLVHKDGEIRWVINAANPQLDDNGEITGYIGTLTDNTDRKLFELELKKSKARLLDSELKLRNLVSRLQEVREEERTRISREIHDELGQSLTGIRIDLAWILENLSIKDKKLTERTRIALMLADETIEFVQNLSFELRPFILDDLGLASAVEWQVNEFLRRTDCHCDLDIELNGVNFTDKQVIGLFRILQESLTNVARHAKATEVSISLRINDDKLYMDISDNGKGISNEQLTSINSIGLIGMHERVEALGGQIEFLIQQPGGTHIQMVIPIEPNGQGTT